MIPYFVVPYLPYWTAIIGSGIVWFLLYYFVKKVRREMLIAGAIVTPLVVIDYFTTPSYWTPHTLGNIPVGIEAFIFTFFITGIAAVIYEVVFGNFANKQKLNTVKFVDFIPAPILGFIVYKLWDLNIIYFIILTLLYSGLIIYIRQPKLRKNIIWSGLTFGLFYLISFSFWTIISPQGLTWWNLKNLSGVLILNVPLEEIIFGFSLGTFVGPLFEFLSEKN